MVADGSVYGSMLTEAVELFSWLGQELGTAEFSIIPLSIESPALAIVDGVSGTGKSCLHRARSRPTHCRKRMLTSGGVNGRNGGVMEARRHSKSAKTVSSSPERPDPSLGAR
jgi:hypothetical protein